MEESAEMESKSAHGESESDMVTIYIMGKSYEVPSNLTIMKAMEYAGYRLIRGCGCRGGFCGACGTVYRTKGDYKLKAGLACQTVVYIPRSSAVSAVTLVRRSVPRKLRL
jgi:hypothetical protein